MTDVLVMTGANGNIGSHLARRFLQEGRRLLLLHHTGHDRVDGLMNEFPGTATSLSADLGNQAELESLLKQHCAEGSLSPTGLIHTAAVRSSDHLSLRESDPAFWAKVLTENVLHAYNILRVFLHLAGRQQITRAVLMGTLVTRSGLKQGSAYSAAKAALANLCRSVAAEEPNLLINMVSPGPVEIDDTHFQPQYAEFRKQYYSEQLPHIPLGRLATPEDLYPLCRHLLLENTYISGQEIYISGGR